MTTREELQARVPKGWYGVDSPPGWDRIVFGLHEALVEEFPDYEIYQVKEKFGGLRFYCNVEDNPIAADLIAAAEVESYKTCETCGQPGSLSLGGGWYRTLCDEHLGSNSRLQEGFDAEPSAS